MYMYVCICTYTSMCIYICIHTRADVCLYGCRLVCRPEMYEMHVMYVCMYVYILLEIYDVV